MPSSIGPSLLLAVAVIVLATGSVSSARALSVAGAQLAMSVMCERGQPVAVAGSQDRWESEGVRVDRVLTARGPVTEPVWDARLVPLLGEGDLPPPAAMLS